MSSWLTPSLVLQIKAVFEPKYGRTLSDDEVITIADNLTDLLEILVKNKIENGV